MIAPSERALPHVRTFAHSAEAAAELASAPVPARERLERSARHGRAVTRISPVTRAERRAITEERRAPAEEPLASGREPSKPAAGETAGPATAAAAAAESSGASRLPRSFVLRWSGSAVGNLLFQRLQQIFNPVENRVGFLVASRSSPHSEVHAIGTRAVQLSRAAPVTPAGAEAH